MKSQLLQKLLMSHNYNYEPNSDLVASLSMKSLAPPLKWDAGGDCTTLDVPLEARMDTLSLVLVAIHMYSHFLLDQTLVR